MKISLISRLLAGLHPTIDEKTVELTPARPSEIALDQPRAALIAAYDEEVRQIVGHVWRDIDPRQFGAGRVILSATPDVQATVALSLLDWILDGSPKHGTTEQSRIMYGRRALLSALLRRRLPYAEDELRRVTRAFVNVRSSGILTSWVRSFVRSLELWTGKDPLSESFKQDLRALRAACELPTNITDLRHAITRIDALLDESVSKRDSIDTSDDWGVHALASYEALPSDVREEWDGVLVHATKLRGTKPSGVWQQQAHELVQAIGADSGPTGQSLLSDWLDFLNQSPPAARAIPLTEILRRGITGEPVPPSVISQKNGDLLRSLVWCCATLDDPAIASALGNAAQASFKKISGVGPRSAKVGNACIAVLGEIGGVHGVAQLQRLRQRLKHRPAIAAVDAALDAAATRSGMSRDDLDDLAVPDFDLIDGKRRHVFGDYAAEIVVVGIQQVEINWFGPDGKPRKTEPVAVKQQFPDEIKAFKRIADDIRTILPTQRDRIERLLMRPRQWSFADWQTHYLDHPLLSQIARRLIWWVETAERNEVGAWHADNLVTSDGRVLNPELTARMRLWHPIESDEATVSAWQDWLDRHHVTQPFKQAHREVYILTDAERTTRVYSNRFASHILRQHQFLALTQGRGWRYRLQGGFDGDNTPTLDLPFADLRVEFLVDPIDGADDSYSTAGISLFITTDQVRFVRPGTWEPLPLDEIPPLIFSEVMRDIDLFVAVCTIGTDPEWADRGLHPHYRYWQHTAFSDQLSASVEMRKVVLQRLLPRLKIADRCQVDGKFVIVRGTLRTYKIHLGSGNIMMEPNNQYLCIVPSRGAAKDPMQHVYLPFEGDSMLSVILSKAFLLADDASITDPTIVRQINRSITVA